MAKIESVDMTHGSIFPKIVRFSLPLAATGILQLLFNAADVIVVGKFSGSRSLAAVGSTSALINLLVGAFIGLSIGANILVARYLGCRQDEHVRRSVHCSIALSAILGVAVLGLGLWLSVPLLRLMQTPDEVLPLAAQYLRIYFLGVPAALVYNFGAAVLRAFGDTRRPLLYLTISGVVNVFLNLLFVIVFRLDVAGVAIATVISQYISLALVLLLLFRAEGLCRLRLRELRLYRDETRQIVAIGLPAGLTSIVFNISNVIIQGAVNSFGASAIAGNAAAASLDSFINNGMDAVAQAAITFTSQNLGAGKYERIGKIYRSCVVTALAIGLPMCAICLLFGPQLLSIYISRADPTYRDVIAFGMVRIRWVSAVYFTCGMMNVCCGMIRGLGKSWLPMFVTAIGACGLRIVWIVTVFAAHRELSVLYASYPVSWIVTSAAHIVCYVFAWRELMRRRDEALQTSATF
jgi:putative MATE family efflux protein